MQRMPRRQIDSHLIYLRSLNCLICGDNTSTEAAHLRFSDARIAKNNAGVGAKADDFFCVPLCSAHHREQHSIGDERAFWRRFGLDPILYSLRLWSVSGNYEMGCQIVEAANANGSARRAAMVVMAG
jgi:hypothetical protein